MTNMATIVLANVLGLLVGFMLGVLIRSSAGAIVGYFVYSFLLPTLSVLLAGSQPGGRAMTFRPTITDMVEQNRLEWLGRLVVPGPFDGRHSFDLEAVGVTETRLTQAEEFSGILVPPMGTMLERTRAGFEATNDALRVRAERSAATSSGL